MAVGKLLRAFGAAAVLVALPSRADASSSSGFQIRVGKFTVRVTYVDVLDYADRAERQIQDPRRLLFTVASIVQANAAAFAHVDLEVWAELGQRKGDPATQLWIWYDVAHTGEHVDVRDGPAPKDVEKELVSVLCGLAKTCVQPKPVLELYQCRRRDACPGVIEFGALPSPSMKKRLALCAPQSGAGERIRVERAEMIRYFDLLD